MTLSVNNARRASVLCLALLIFCQFAGPLPGDEPGKGESPECAHARRIRDAMRAWQTDDLPRMRELLAGCVPRDKAADQRGWEWHYLQALVRGHLWTTRGHTASVQSVAWRPDGKRLATAGGDKTIMVWDAVTGKPLLTIPREGNTIFLAWSLDGKRLATITREGRAGDTRIQISDAVSGKEIFNRAFKAAPQSRPKATPQSRPTVPLAWSPDFQKVVLVTPEGNVKVHDPVKDKDVFSLPFQGNVDWARFSPDGKRLATARGIDGLIRVTDAERGKVMWTLPAAADRADRIAHRANGLLGDLQNLAWQKDGEHLTGITNGGEVRTWDKMGKQVRGQRLVGSQPNEQFSPQGSAVAWSADGKLLAGRAVQVWDVEAGSRLLTLRLIAREESPRHATALSWSPEGRRLAVGGESGVVRVWDLDQIRPPLRRLTPLPRGPDGRVTGLLRPSPDGKRLLWAPDPAPWNRGDQPRMLDGATGRTIAVLRDDAGEGASVSWSPDGKRVAAGYQSGLIRLWDPETGRLVSTLYGHDQTVAYVTWSADNKRLASVGRDQTVRVWDVATSKELRILRMTEPIRLLQWSPDGKRVAVRTSSHLRILPVEVGLDLSLPAAGLNRVEGVLAWRPDGLAIAYALVGTGVIPRDRLCIHDVAAGKELHRWRAQPRAVSWSADGKKVTALVLREKYNGNEMLRTWEAATGNEATPTSLTGGKGEGAGATHSAHLSPDGKWVSLVRFTRTMVYACATGKLALTFPNLGMSKTMQWAPDGRLARGDAQSVEVGDPASGRLLSTLNQVGAPFVVGLSAIPGGWLSWSPDGALLATAGTNGGVLLWKAATGKRIRLLGRPVSAESNRLQRAVWSPDSAQVAVANQRGEIEVWSAAGERQRILDESDGGPTAVDVDAKGKWIASGNHRGKVTVWDAASGARAHSFPGHAGSVQMVAFSPDGKSLASISLGEVRVWDLSSGKERFSGLGTASPFLRAAWSSDSRLLAAVAVDVLKVWDAESGKEKLIRSLAAPPFHPFTLWGPAVSWPKPGQVAVAGWGGVVAIWELETGKNVAAAPAKAIPQAQLSWDGEGKLLALLFPSPPTGKPGKPSPPRLEVREGLTGKVIFSQTVDSRVEQPAVWSPNGRLLAVEEYKVSKGKGRLEVTVRDARSGKVAHRLRLATGPMIWGTNSRTLYTWSADGMQAWDLSTDKSKPLPGPRLGGIARRERQWVLRSGELVLASAQAVEVWDLTKGKQRLAVGGRSDGLPPVVMAWSRDKRLLAAGIGLKGELRVWQTDNGKQLHSFPGDGKVVRGLTWSPGGKRLATLDVSGKVRVVVLATGKEEATFSTVAPKGRGLAHLDGEPISWGGRKELIAVGESDGQVSLWKPGLARPVLSVKAQKESVLSVAWSRDGRRLFTLTKTFFRGTEIFIQDEQGEILLTLSGGDTPNDLHANGSGGDKLLDLSADGWRLSSGNSSRDVTPAGLR